MKYDQLSQSLQERMAYDRAHHKRFPFACSDQQIIRRDLKNPRDHATLWRPGFVRDCEKILHSNFYERYTDKTQVFSFYKNDDISRRGLHVQLVSRIARNIGRALGLNLDLIEAIALGHDIGHTPFGHAGEKILCALYHERTGRFFAHNVHSIRVLDGLIPYNLSLQTLDGILCHNGELELSEYHPRPLGDFSAFDRQVEQCYTDCTADARLIPGTLEGCVVRVCDIIAYLGKDRQDAYRAHRIQSEEIFPDSIIGTKNAEIINNLTVNIIENSYGREYLKMDRAYFDALSEAKKINYQMIYLKDQQLYAKVIQPMMEQIYGCLLRDVIDGKETSPIFTHHILPIEQSPYRQNMPPYRLEEKDQIVVDYIASMTDDYFLDLYAYLYPKSDLKIQYIGYFDKE